MEPYEPFISLAVALACGLVIGFEREQAAAARHQDDVMFGGARTHPLFALVGALATLLSRQFGAVAFVIGFLALLVFLGIGYWHSLLRGKAGSTSEAAALLSYLLGALSTSHGVVEPLPRRVLVVASVTVIVTTLLSVKPALHTLAARVSSEDIYATLKFLLVAVVALPLLPDATLGPLEVLNPRHIGFMVVLIAGLSFVGYVAIRLLGPRRGLGLTGLVGGLASSTAVTLSMSQHARRDRALERACALAIVLASTIMFLRVLVVVAVANASLVKQLAVPTASMAVAGLAVSAFFYLRSRAGAAGAPGEVKFTNPFELGSALKFAVLYAGILLGTKALTLYFGTKTTYLAAVLAGATDVDAITLSMSNLAAGGLAQDVAVTSIVLAMISNTAVKAGMTVVVGGWEFGRKLAATLGVVGAVGVAALVLQRML